MVTNNNLLIIGALPLQAIAEQNERLIGLSRDLRSRSETGKVVTGIDCRQYLSGSRLELYVETELAGGIAVCWWIDVDWSGPWTIESKIYCQDDNGQAVLTEFPVRTASNAEYFADELSAAVDVVIDSAINFDYFLAGY